MRRVTRRAGVLAIGGALLLAGPAAAHPFVRGGELPVDSLATMTLAMAHGCGSEASGEGDPTTDVSLQVPDWLRVVEVPEEDGWLVELEEDDDGTLEVVTWTADGAEEPAPDFDLEVVASGEVGDEFYLALFQACDDVVYRWVGTPDAPADDPAIRVRLVESDPSSPPPPEPEPEETTEPSEDTSTSEDAATDDDEPGEAADPLGSGEPTDDLTGDPDATDEPTEDDELPSDPLAAEGDDGGLPGWFLPVTIVVILGAVAALVLGRRGRAEA